MGVGRWIRRENAVTFPLSPSTFLPSFLDLLTLRLAASGGSIDGHAASALVAAGFTLLQRSAALVRALDGRRAGVLLPPSPQFLVALGAAEGRGALLLGWDSDATTIADVVRTERIGVLFTLADAVARLPAGTMRVLLDGAPRSADVVVPDAERRSVDLGSHFPLTVEGDATAPGRDEEGLVTYDDGTHRWISHSHRELIDGGRRRAVSLTPSDLDVDPAVSWADLGAFLDTGLGPLLAGARLRTRRGEPRLAGAASTRVS